MFDYSNFIENVSGQFGNMVPGALGALVVLFIGLIVANIIKRIVAALFKRTTLDERLATSMNSNTNIGAFVAKLAYYLVMMFVLLIVLDILGVKDVLVPLQNMLDGFVKFIPQLIGAGIIGYVGYILSTIVSGATGFISEKAEGFALKQGISTGMDISEIIRKVVFAIVFIPIFIIALDTLGLEAVAGPAKEMLGTLLNSIPNILAAGIIIAVFYFVGKFIVNFLVSLLNSMNIDSYASKIGIDNIVGDTSIAKTIGNLVFALLMFAGITTALEKLGMTSLVAMMNNLYGIAGNILFGLIILMAGNWISKTASEAVAKSPEDAWLASIVRFTLLGLFLAMGLGTMGIGENIVNLAFGLTLGAVAVAFALSFGLGGREAAGKTMEDFLGRFRGGNGGSTKIVRKDN